jgi:hypothetical protein
MNKKITSVLLGILLIGIVSAGVVAYLSNTITGSVTVEGPVFYASNEHPLGGSTYWGLGINDYIPGDPVSFIGSDPKFFVSEKLGVDSFYPADYKIYIETESNNESGQIDAEIYFVEGNSPYNKKLDVCSGSTIIPVYEKGIYEIDCSAGELTSINPNWKLVLRLSDGMESIHYNIYINGNSKIEVSAK